MVERAEEGIVCMFDSSRRKLVLTDCLADGYYLLTIVLFCHAEDGMSR